MKILHLSTYDKGGAATAALRLHDGLLKNGIDSSFLVLHKNSKRDDVTEHAMHHSGLMQKAFNYLGFPQTTVQKNYMRIKNKTNTGAPFTFPITGIDVTQNDLIKNADIINLHWVSDFIDYSSFFKKINKPVVWTLHDMNPFMGGFHYSTDKEQNKFELDTLEKQFENIKQIALEKFKNLSIVSPSKWLLELSENSNILSAFKHYYIPYGLDLDIFKTMDRREARRLNNLPDEKIILTFISDNIKIHRKGFDLLLQSVKKLNSSTNILFCAIGQNNEEMNSDIHYFGSIQDNQKLSSLYAASDAIIIPSRQDNLPNVMLEALATGTPVIAFNTGGMKDVITNEYTGFLADTIDAAELLKGINNFLLKRKIFNKREIRKFAEDFLSLDQQAKSYINLYNQILNHH
ncbi:MAG: glycosyltransferase [Bacteroidia bacterium]